jgi:DnaJ-class molecular chaperone
LRQLLICPEILANLRERDIHQRGFFKYGESAVDREMDPEKYGVVLCPCCNGVGYIQNRKRQCCPKCGGFGFVKSEAQEDMNTSPIIEKGKGGT